MTEQRTEAASYDPVADVRRTLSRVVPSMVAAVVSFDGAWKELEGPVVALYDGKLQGRHAAALDRPIPAFLLACRDGAPVTSWEMDLVAALWQGRSLLPAAADSAVVGAVKDIALASASASAAAEQAGAGRAAQDIVVDVSHELVANALLDAPVDSEGKVKYAHERGPSAKIASEDACEFRYRARDGKLWMSVKDRFGRLTPGPLAKAIRGYDERAQIDTSGGGAGLGMRRLVEHSDALAVRVLRGRMCEVLSVVDLGPVRRRASLPKTILFHIERG